MIGHAEEVLAVLLSRHLARQDPALLGVLAVLGSFFQRKIPNRNLV